MQYLWDATHRRQIEADKKLEEVFEPKTGSGSLLIVDEAQHLYMDNKGTYSNPWANTLWKKVKELQLGPNPAGQQRLRILILTAYVRTICLFETP